MASITANAVTGNASAGSSWVGGVAPVTGDIAVIPVGADITWDYSVALGNAASNVGHALHIQAASSVSFGRVTVADGVILNLAGVDKGTACPLVNDQWGQFIVSPGATVEWNAAADDVTQVFNNGIFHAIGNAGSHAVLTTPAANRTWNTAATVTPTLAGAKSYDVEHFVEAYPLIPGIANAAGTGLGSLGDSSLTFSVNPGGLFATEVASIEAITGAGDYYVDYTNGLLFYYQNPPSTTSWTANFTRLAFFGMSIVSTVDADGNEVIVDYCDVHYMGVETDSRYVFDVRNKMTASGTSRSFQFTNVDGLFCNEVLQFQNVIGTALAPVQVEDNRFFGINATNGGAAGVLTLGASTSYVSFKRNVGVSALGPVIEAFDVGASHDHWAIDDCAFIAPVLLRGGTTTTTWPDLHIGSFVMGLGGQFDSHTIFDTPGTSGHPVVVESIFWRQMRVINLTSYNQLQNSLIGYTTHHTTMGPNNDLVYVPGLVASYNLIINTYDNGALQLAYNGGTFQDGAQAVHNTIHNAPNWSALGFGDQSDPDGANLFSGLTQSSNLVTAAAYGIRRIADDSAHMSRVHVAGMDYNNIFGSTTADYAGISRFATFSGIANVAGCSLFNPSYAAPISGKSLSLVVTSPTNQTLAWDGGAAVQLVQDTGTASSASNGATWGNLVDSTKTWPSAFDDPASVVGCWIVITGGTGAGQIRRVAERVTSTWVAVLPAWDTIPDNTSTYALVKSEVVLTASDGTNTVNCGVDARALPATSQTDAAIGMTMHTLFVDPQYVDDTRTLATWDASLGGPGTETSAIARLFATPTLARSSFQPYMLAGFTPKNTALKGAAADGGDIGAVPVFVPASSGLLQMTCLQRIGV